VRTLAGAGVRGSGDGVGAAALFASPGGVAAAPAGDVLWIADTGNHRLRRLDLATGAHCVVGWRPHPWELRARRLTPCLAGCAQALW
jgi:sugar lactone lactonase YvrE